MTTVAANVISLFNSLPLHEQDMVRSAINKRSSLRAELNFELARAKNSPILSDAEAESKWGKFSVKTS
ncbi:MAG: hypothetical protein LBG82_07210 [Clostridiales Family XIII bacterium]|jgi:hypothetical protein|nr:hypothetical protein [Clostridiales Family XIII bacterium]